MTYLQLVQNVLKRLRERSITDVSENDLIGIFVNDAKAEVEQAWNWSALRTTLSATTSQGVFSFELTGSGDNPTMLDVVNDTSNWFMEYKTARDFNNYYLNMTPAQGAPKYYSFNGLDSNGDTIVEVFPPPDGVYNIRFNLVDRRPEMSANSDELLIPSRPVELLAYAKAVEERGEDGGISPVSAYAVAQRALNDAISYDAAKHPEELIWYTT